jgi:hypothetical protein
MLILIVKPKKNDTNRKDGIGFHVCTDPEDAESDKIKIFVPPFESGDLEEVLEFVDSFRNLTRLKGLKENGPALFQHAHVLLREDALANFVACHNDAMESIDEGDETERQDIFTAVFEAWMAREVPDELTGRMLKKSVSSEKLNKPYELTVSEFVKRLKKINKYITYCQGATAALTNEDLITVLELFLGQQK